MKFRGQLLVRSLKYAMYTLQQILELNFLEKTLKKFKIKQKDLKILIQLQRNRTFVNMKPMNNPHFHAGALCVIALAIH